jgi:hypothetical protein
MFTLSDQENNNDVDDVENEVVEVAEETPLNSK